MNVRTLILALSLGLSGLPAGADQSIAATIADGQPWNAVGPGGMSMQITFFPDGTVRMRAGIMRMSMAWTATDDGMCVTGGPRGDRCIRFEAQGTGYIGYDGSEEPLVLSR